MCIVPCRPDAKCCSVSPSSSPSFASFQLQSRAVLFHFDGLGFLHALPSGCNEIPLAIWSFFFPVAARCSWLRCASDNPADVCVQSAHSGVVAALRLVVALAFDMVTTTGKLAKAEGSCVCVCFDRGLYSHSRHPVTHDSLSYPLPLHQDDHRRCFNFHPFQTLLDGAKIRYAFHMSRDHYSFVFCLDLLK